MRLQDALDQLALQTKRARRRLGLERGLRAGLWVAAALALWAMFGLLGLHERLPLLGQSLTSIAALIGFLWLTLRARRAWRAPTDAEARQRLAEDSQLEIAAFESLRDHPTRYDAASMALWKRERERALARVASTKIGPLRLGLNERDPFRLRYLLAVGLVAALVFAGVNAPDRLARAFAPDPGPLLGDQPMAVEAWVTPADYTHAAPISLSDAFGQTIETPPSVEVTVRLTGPTGAPHLVYEGQGGRRSVDFTRAADDVWEARLAVPGRGTVKIVRFHNRGFWRIRPAADNAPTASFAAPVAPLAEERVAISWRASDDFGVRRLVLRTRPIDRPADLSRADAFDIEIEAPAGDPTEASDETEIDLASHPYAGLEVEAQIVAFDALGQEGASAPLRFTMPERVFLQPVARAALEIRRHILSDRRPYREASRGFSPPWSGAQAAQADLARAPGGVRRAARLLDVLTIAPEDGYFSDLAVFLGLRLARAQLDAAVDLNDADGAAETLWLTALRAEYGGASDARRALEEAQQRLADALARGAPPEEIRPLMDALRRAADAYLEALVQETLREGQRTPPDETRSEANITNNDIEEMLREVERLSREGRTQEAQALLAMLAGILANLEVHLTERPGGDGGDQQQNESLQQSIDQLAEAMGEQRALRDETRQQSGGASGGDGEQQGRQGGDELAARQSGIRDGLGEARRMAEDASSTAPSDNLDAAGEAMRRSEDALRRGDLDGAARAQDEALNELREGAEALAAELRDSARDQAGRGGERGSEARAVDPLGRGNDTSGRLDTSGGLGDAANSRVILNEIRRRAEDPTRPESERAYLRRLLDRFGGGS
jgi:hypothetical protein